MQRKVQFADVDRTSHFYTQSCALMQIKCWENGFPLQSWKLPFKLKGTRKRIPKARKLNIKNMQVDAQSYILILVWGGRTGDCEGLHSA